MATKLEIDTFMQKLITNFDLKVNHADFNKLQKIVISRENSLREIEIPKAMQQYHVYKSYNTHITRIQHLEEEANKILDLQRLPRKGELVEFAKWHSII